MFFSSSHLLSDTLYKLTSVSKFSCTCFAFVSIWCMSFLIVYISTSFYKAKLFTCSNLTPKWCMSNLKIEFYESNLLRSLRSSDFLVATSCFDFVFSSNTFASYFWKTRREPDMSLSALDSSFFIATKVASIISFIQVLNFKFFHHGVIPLIYYWWLHILMVV